MDIKRFNEEESRVVENYWSLRHKLTTLTSEFMTAKKEFLSLMQEKVIVGEEGAENAK